MRHDEVGGHCMPSWNAGGREHMRRHDRWGRPHVTRCVREGAAGMWHAGVEDNVGCAKITCDDVTITCDDVTITCDVLRLRCTTWSAPSRSLLPPLLRRSDPAQAPRHAHPEKIIGLIPGLAKSLFLTPNTRPSTCNTWSSAF